MSDSVFYDEVSFERWVADRGIAVSELSANRRIKLEAEYRKNVENDHRVQAVMPAVVTTLAIAAVLGFGVPITDKYVRANTAAANAALKKAIDEGQFTPPQQEFLQAVMARPDVLQNYTMTFTTPNGTVIDLRNPSQQDAAHLDYLRNTGIFPGTQDVVDSAWRNGNFYHYNNRPSEQSAVLTIKKDGNELCSFPIDRAAAQLLVSGEPHPAAAYDPRAQEYRINYLCPTKQTPKPVQHLPTNAVSGAASEGRAETTSAALGAAL